MAKKTISGVKKKNFSSFNLKTAFQQLGNEKLLTWSLPIGQQEPSQFLQEYLTRLDRFDLRSNERGKELLIDALCQEAIQPFPMLKIWKGAPLEGEVTIGEVDYLATKDRDYLEAPFLCVVEAKKDNFEQGLAQCLVEMQACQWTNQQLGHDIDVFGIVSNGTTWEFYKLTLANQVYGSAAYSLGEISHVLAALNYVFGLCQAAIAQV
jgi:hypothetical protein